MQLGSIARRLFRDLGLKLAAIFLATALYLHVHREAEREQTFRVPLVWSCAAPGPSRASLPDSATVRLRASTAELARLAPGSIRVLADLCGADTGSLVYRRFTAADVVLPPEVRVLEAEILEPPPVYARVDRGSPAPP